MFIPNGRLSAVTWNGEKVQIQTEFAPNPRPRVTTCVVLGGRVVHKEEQPWDSETGTPVGQRELEAFLQKQHFAVHTRVERNEIELGPIIPLAARDDIKMPTGPTPPRHPAGAAPGVLRAFIVSKSGDVIAVDESKTPRPTHAGFFQAAAEFIDFWEASESDRFGQMLTRDCEGNFLLVRHFGKYWGAELTPGADPDATLQAFLKALEQ
jgi:hypothetical protein